MTWPPNHRMSRKQTPLSERTIKPMKAALKKSLPLAFGVIALTSYFSFFPGAWAGPWVPTGSMSIAAGDRQTPHGTATLLHNGKVLVTHAGSSTAELYSPDTGIWTTTSPLG